MSILSLELSASLHVGSLSQYISIILFFFDEILNLLIMVRKNYMYKE